ncbi:hypothetical protein ABH941_007965 [Streptacidiphilus sp. EB103A]
MATTLADITEPTADTWPRHSVPARLHDLHYVILAALADVAATSAPQGTEENWLDAGEEHLTDSETLLLRRASAAPQRVEALGELATFMARLNSPELEELGGPPVVDDTGHSLLRLADTYRKIVIEFVGRAARPTQTDRTADQPQDTHDGPAQERGAETG